jgi:quercetin dioxygenase-like cupin family protein
MKRKYLFREEELEWIDHPKIEGGKSTTIFSQERQGAQGTVGMVKLPKGQTLPWHDHGKSDDILFVVAGKGKLEMEGIGDLEMKKGCHILVPGLIKHRIHDITEDLTLYHVKAPPTV